MDLIVKKNVGADKNQIEYEILSNTKVRFHRRWDTKSGASHRVPGKENCSHYKGVIEIPETVVDKEKIYTVVELGERGGHNGDNGAFYSALEVKHVSVPRTVLVLFDYTFAYCHKLESVTLEEGLKEIEYKCFYDCENLKRIIIPDSVVLIGKNAFLGCCNLTEATIGRNVYQLDSTFKECRKLKRVICRNPNPPIISADAFEEETFDYGELLVPYQALDLYKGHSAWGKFKKIGYYDTPSTVIPPQTWPVIGTLYVTSSKPKNKDGLIVYKDADKDNNQIEFEFLNDTKVRLHPRKITHHGMHLIAPGENCSHYKGEVMIPENVKDEKGYVYTVVELGQRGGGDNAAFYQAAQVTTVSVPGTVRVLFDRTFWYCSNLHRIILNEGIEEIEEYCFWYCTNLHKVVIPDSVRLIGERAFLQCESLEEATIGMNVRRLDSTFKKCIRLEKVTCRATTPPAYLNTPFDDFTLRNGVLFVPANSVNLYKSADGWRQFTNIRAI